MLLGRLVRGPIVTSHGLIPLAVAPCLPCAGHMVEERYPVDGVAGGRLLGPDRPRRRAIPSQLLAIHGPPPDRRGDP